MGLEHRQEEVLLALEVGVHRALREAGVLRHLVHRGALDAALRRDLGGRAHEAGPGVGLPLLARQPTGLHQAAAARPRSCARAVATISPPRSGTSVIALR